MENFGRNAQDKVTGFKGIITGKCFYMYGCAQYLLVGKVNKEGKNEAIWYDEGRITILKGGINPKIVKVEKGGSEFRDDAPNIR